MPSPCPAYPSVPASSSPRVPHYDRAEAALKLRDFEEARAQGLSQRAAAAEAGIPRTTALYWQSRREASALPKSVALFLESPDGLAWLHCLVLAAVFVMTLRGPEGIRLVCEFLELTAGTPDAWIGELQPRPSPSLSRPRTASPAGP